MEVPAFFQLAKSPKKTKVLKHLENKPILEGIQRQKWGEKNTNRQISKIGFSLCSHEYRKVD